ncbi:endolytic transglycosylase MltG [Desulfoplanes formicivorans]|uniref:Endolytic murein transglycosylase n=1 Tax=Desulfoplanes formicivorans TaxID=1592317 RepID=A0A194AG69_9BACT|nr:endolytic transglycosylase MltG [Desulfoplanes formicivorans]GAU08081.1 aminodeoxychorismate lyase [Desulfoplanes formicivorans]
MHSCRLSPLQRFLLVFLGAMLLAAGVLLYQVHHFLHTAPEHPGTPLVVRISPGMSFSAIAALLESKGIVVDRTRFALLGRFMNKAGSVRAGEFTLHTGWTPMQVLEELGRGRDILYPLTIPEGLTWWQTADLVQASGLGTRQGFARIVSDRDFLARWHIPGDNAEGYLFPETYLFPRVAITTPGNTPTEQDLAIANHLLAMFREKTKELFPPDMSPEAIRDILTLASLVEKETSRDDERARIAGVYANRLRKNMRLQCDPTIIYGIGPDFDGNLTRKHLRDRSNPYNTYMHPGLPPGPICSPGLASIKAALHPESHTYLYFVARGDGSHAFSRTLREHNQYVRTYQLHR